LIGSNREFEPVDKHAKRFAPVVNRHPEV